MTRLLKFASLLICFAVLTALLSSCGFVTSNEENNDLSGNNSDVSDVTLESSFESSDISQEDDYSEPDVPEDTVVSFLACPDNIIHPSVFYDAIEREAANNNTNPDYSDLHNAKYDFSQIYEYVDEAILNADISYLNQETLIGGTSGKIIGYPCFNSPDDVADMVIELGVDVVNVAHNHMLDSGNTKYLENCNNVFENAGIEVIGYYPNKASTQNITVLNSKGISISFLAYTYGTNGIKLPPESDFVIPYFDDELVKEQVAYAKAVSDVIIVSCHWGYEDTFNINSEQKHYAELMCELGVDVVLGMHPHVIQPMEWMTSSSGSKTLVVYSLGNFVSGMVGGKNMLAGMLSLDIIKDAETNEISIQSPTFIPIVTHYVKKDKVASNDTGYRDFKIYYLNDYTEALAAEHGVCKYEKSHGTTLVGGGFSKETLLNTLHKYIPAEFLPDEFQNQE